MTTFNVIVPTGQVIEIQSDHVFITPERVLHFFNDASAEFDEGAVKSLEGPGDVAVFQGYIGFFEVGAGRFVNNNDL